MGRYVLLPGDPARVDRIGAHLEDVEPVAHSREFQTITGRYRDIEISAMSTGLGRPSASIAVEELVNAGATHFIRVGSTAGIQPGVRTGDIVINTGVLRNDGTSRAYVPDTYPAVADHFLVHALIGRPGSGGSRRASACTSASAPATTPSTRRRPSGSSAIRGSDC